MPELDRPFLFKMSEAAGPRRLLNSRGTRLDLSPRRSFQERYATHLSGMPTSEAESAPDVLLGIRVGKRPVKELDE